MRKNSLWKRLCASVLAAALAASGAAITASAAGRTPDGTIDEIFDYKYVKGGYTDDDESTDTVNDAEVVKKIAEAAMSGKKSVDISSYDLSVEDALGVTIMVRDIYPEIFFTKKMTVASNGDVASNVSIQYQDTDSEGNPDIEKIQQRLQEFYDEADRYLELASDQLNYCKDDFSKAFVIHDQIVQDAYYDLSNRDNDVFMKDKHGVCATYSQVYAYLLGQLGIKTELIYTPEDEMNHQWIKIKLDGKYYNIDITWADPLTNGKDQAGKVEHTYFLLSDAKIQSLPKPHTGYKTMHDATDTKYDDAPFHEYNSRFCKTDAQSTTFYAVNNETKQLVSYDYVSGKEKTIIDLNGYKWKSTAENRSYIKGFANLAEYGGYLFFNTATDIYRYDPATGKYGTIGDSVDDGKQFFGLRIKDGKLYSVVGEYAPEEAEEILFADVSKAASAAQTVTISTKPSSIKIGDSVELKAALSPASSIDKVSWESSSDKIAVIETSGNKSYLKGKGEGSATITAVTTSGAKASFKVSVTSDEIKVTGITLSKTSVSVGLGRTVSLSATVKPTNATNKKITWTSSDKSIAAVDSNGKVTGKKLGTVTIKATSSNLKTASCKVKVTAVKATGIKIADSPIVLKEGSKTELKAVITPSDTTDQSVSWHSDNGSVAWIEIKNNKAYVIGKGIGTTKITATTSNGKKTTCKVTVKNKVEVTKVKLNKTKLDIKKGKSATLKATVSPTTASDKTIKWKSSNKSVVTVNSKGKITAKKAGTATITATSSSGKKATCKVTVKVPSTKIKLNKTKLTVIAGNKATIKATLTPSDSTDKLTWTSSDKKVASVTAKGHVYAKKSGTTTITVKTASGKKATCKVTVKKNPEQTATIAARVGRFHFSLKDRVLTVKIYSSKFTVKEGRYVTIVVNNENIKVENTGTQAILTEYQHDAKVVYTAFE